MSVRKRNNKSKRPKNYEPKLQVADNVTFDALMTVAVNYQPKKKAVASPKKKKKS